MINCKKCNYWQSKDRTFGLCLRKSEHEKSKKNEHTIIKTLYTDFCNGFHSAK